MQLHLKDQSFKMANQSRQNEISVVVTVMCLKVPLAAFSALQVVIAGLTGAAVSVDDVRETLALPRYLHAGRLAVHRAVPIARTSYRGEQERKGQKSCSDMVSTASNALV